MPDVMMVAGIRLPLVHGDQLEQRYEARLGDWPIRIRSWCGCLFLELGSPIIFSAEGDHIDALADGLVSFLSQAARASQAVAS